MRLPAYTVNEDAVRHATRLIEAPVRARSRWQDVQPRAREQNASQDALLGGVRQPGISDSPRARPRKRRRGYAFVYGDFRRLHRMGLIACHYRAAEWRHKEIELAAHELLQYLDRKTGS